MNTAKVALAGLTADGRPVITRLRAEKALDSAPVEPDDDVAVDHRHGCGPVPEPLELCQGLGLLLDVLDRERDPLLRKKLFLSVAAESARLRVEGDFLRQLILLCSRSLLAEEPPEQRSRS